MMQQVDLEDFATSTTVTPSHPPTVTKHRRTLTSSQRMQLLQRETWRDVLGPPPSQGSTKVTPHTLTPSHPHTITPSLSPGGAIDVAILPQTKVEVAVGPKTGKKAVATTTGKGCGHKWGRGRSNYIIQQPGRVSTATELCANRPSLADNSSKRPPI